MDPQFEELSRIYNRLSKKGQKAVLRRARRYLAEMKTPPATTESVLDAPMEWDKITKEIVAQEVPS